MVKSSSMSIRIDPQVKADVEAIYSRYGLSITEAINIFLHQSVNVGGLPFDLRPQPNALTLAAMKEGEALAAAGQARFHKPADLLKDLKS
ncbi:type II toxin-antitoxin system RelB/DinJ family antitoxin [Deltaproteobacteria bacterium OttesenSCG-928-M10]|nr:type II toxin-antitoxin system RelB/DinJ family antitoxin [Deltaproteobacteria bacterium OttesenSCG-928-M10]